MLICMSNEHIHYSSEFGIGRIEFYNSRGNSLTSTLLDEMTQFIMASNEDPDTKIIVIQSGGDGAFCGGASLDELHELKTYEQVFRFFMGFAQLILRIRNCRKPVITRVHGKAVGGGIGLIAASDLAFASTSAAVKLSELSIGIGPFVIGPAVERKIGTAAFSELTYLSSTWKDSKWAKERGLYAEIFESNHQLDEMINHTLFEMMGYDLDAFAANKKMIWQQTPEWEKILEHRAEISAALWMQKKAG